MKNVNAVSGKDGVLRLYFRKKGMPSVPLKSPLPPEGEEEGSALQAEVNALLAQAPAKAAPSTLRHALRTYELESPDYAALAASTKALYQVYLKELDEDFGDLHVSTFTAAYLMQLRNTWSKRGYRAAGNLLTVLHNALRPAIIGGAFGGNDPFALIPGVRRPHDKEEPHIIWPMDVVMTVIETALREGRFGLAAGVAIGRFAGARRGDIVAMTTKARWAGRIAWTSGKRKVPVDLAEADVLAAVLNRIPKSNKAVTLVYNVSGLPYTENGFHNALTAHVERLFKADLIPDDRYTAHGLRHTYGVEGALAGWTDAIGMARMGHSSPATFATYRRQADRIRLSDMGGDLTKQFRERTSNGEVQNQVQNICKIELGQPPRARGKNLRK